MTQMFPFSPSMLVQSRRPTTAGLFCWDSVAQVSHELQAGSGQSWVLADASLRAQHGGL